LITVLYHVSIEVAFAKLGKCSLLLGVCLEQVVVLCVSGTLHGFGLKGIAAVSPELLVGLRVDC